jgi:hypothetical protein
MQSATQTSLFTELSAEEASNINGARRRRGGNYYYYSPSSYSYDYPRYGCGYYGGYSGGGYAAPSVNQTVNVNVQIED